MSQEAEMKTTWGHPQGLFYLFFAELWERFSFYGMRALLTLYMVKEVFVALSNSDTVTAITYSAYGSLVYATPVIGGRLADKLLGYRKAILLGGTLMAIGHFVLAIQNNMAFFLALAFIIVGNGFFKPNISTFVGALYPKGDNRKDSGFTIFYMGINIGAFVSPLICGWLGETYGWHYGFGLAGVGMVTGLLVFMNGIKKGIFQEHGLAPDENYLQSKKGFFSVKQWVYVGSIIAVPVIAWLLSQYQFIFGGESFLGEVTIVNVIFRLLGISVLGYLIYIMINVSKEERERLIVAVFLIFWMTIFWGFHELSGSIITLFADRNVAMVGLNASQSNAINPLFIILLSIPMSAMWIYLNKKKINPRTPYKFAMGLLWLGLSFYILSISGSFADSQGMVPMAFLFVMYFFLSIGELFMSPVGLSKMTDLSPLKIVAFIMGVWFLSSAYAFQIVGFVGQKLAIEESADISGMESLNVYTGGFEYITYFALGASAVAFIMSPILKKWMHGVH